MQKPRIGKKIIGKEIDMKNYFVQKMERIVLVDEKFCCWKISKSEN